MRRSIFYFALILVLILSSCKDRNNNKSGNKIEPIQTTATSSGTSQYKADERYIGEWLLPITSQISTSVQLYYDSTNHVYFTKERERGSKLIDSLVVVVSRNGNDEFSIEYAGITQDNYVILDKQSVQWRSPGYNNVTCDGIINIDKLAATYEQYRSRSAVNLKANLANPLTEKEKAALYEWSKRYVKFSVVKPSSLSFPGVSSVKFINKQSYYIIEYKATGKDLYNKSVVYPVRIQFEKDEKGEPTFLSISLE